MAAIFGLAAAVRLPTGQPGFGGAVSAQGGACPVGEPGTVVWSVAPATARIRHLAVGDDGLLVGGTDTLFEAFTSGRFESLLFGMDCRGEYWTIDPLTPNGLGPRMLTTAPVLDAAGNVVISTTEEGAPLTSSDLREIDPEGRPRWHIPWSRSLMGLFFKDVTLDGRGSAMAMAFMFPNGSVDSVPRAVPVIIVIDRFGWVEDMRPVMAHGLTASPIALSGDRFVMATSGIRMTLDPAQFPTPSPPRPVATQLPFAAFLPVVRTDRWPVPGTSEFELVTLDLPSRLMVVTSHDPRIDLIPADVTGAFVLAATGNLVVAASNDPAPRLVAFDLSSPTEAPLWEHFTGRPIVQTPVLGRRDEATGRLEVVYVRDDAVLVSLDAPGTASAAGGVTFNWAVELETMHPSLSPPVLGDAGSVYVAFGNRVGAFDRTDGRERWTVAVPAGQATDHQALGGIALAPNGTLYVTSTDVVGTSPVWVTAIATESGGLDPEAGWPTLRHDSRRTGRATQR